VLYLSRIEHEQLELSEKLIRLHVVANSDSEADQAYKLQIRDELLQSIKPILDDAQNRDDAVKLLADALPQLNADMKSADCTLTIGKEFFPERDYDTFSLPAGEYTALRAVIGDGNGKNWWCVLFPPLCMEAVTSLDADSTDAFALLTEDETALITGSNSGIKIKFRILDVIDEFRRMFD